MMSSGLRVYVCIGMCVCVCVCVCVGGCGGVCVCACVRLTAVCPSQENLSVGQRQLMCLGRALIRSAKVIFMDEGACALLLWHRRRRGE